MDLLSTALIMSRTTTNLYLFQIVSNTIQMMQTTLTDKKSILTSLSSEISSLSGGVNQLLSSVSSQLAQADQLSSANLLTLFQTIKATCKEMLNHEKNRAFLNQEISTIDCPNVPTVLASLLCLAFMRYVAINLSKTGVQVTQELSTIQPSPYIMILTALALMAIYETLIVPFQNNVIAPITTTASETFSPIFSRQRRITNYLSAPINLDEESSLYQQMKSFLVEQNKYYQVHSGYQPTLELQALAQHLNEHLYGNTQTPRRPSHLALSAAEDSLLNLLEAVFMQIPDAPQPSMGMRLV